METAYDGRQVVGMDLHRGRSVLVRMTEDGLQPIRTGALQGLNCRGLCLPGHSRRGKFRS